MRHNRISRIIKPKPPIWGELADRMKVKPRNAEEWEHIAKLLARIVGDLQEAVYEIYIREVEWRTYEIKPIVEELYNALRLHFYTLHYKMFGSHPPEIKIPEATDIGDLDKAFQNAWDIVTANIVRELYSKMREMVGEMYYNIDGTEKAYKAHKKDQVEKGFHFLVETTTQAYKALKGTLENLYTLLTTKWFGENRGGCLIRVSHLTNW